MKARNIIFQKRRSPPKDKAHKQLSPRTVPGFWAIYIYIHMHTLLPRSNEEHRNILLSPHPVLGQSPEVFFSITHTKWSDGQLVCTSLCAVFGLLWARTGHPEKTNLWTDTGADQNFQRERERDLGAIGPHEFQGTFVWTNPSFAFFSGNSYGPMALKVRQSCPKTGIGPWLALPSHLPQTERHLDIKRILNNSGPSLHVPGCSLHCHKTKLAVVNPQQD